MDMVTKEYFNEKTKFPCLYNKSFTLITFDSNIEAKILKFLCMLLASAQGQKVP